MKQIYKYRWQCNWTNGKSCWNPDFEICSAVGGWCTNPETAIRDAIKHNRAHPWHGWGYAPREWSNTTAYVVKRSIKTRKVTIHIPDYLLGNRIHEN